MGGPAPGINCAISSATIEARNSGVEVIGLYDGFEHLLQGVTDQSLVLDIPEVSRIHTIGGSILRTSRANPTSKPGLLERTVETLQRLDITELVTIGGEDTATSAAAVARTSNGSLRVAHIPKTIDNDLPLPAGMPTFGHETARQVGAEQVLNLMEEARTGNRLDVRDSYGPQRRPPRPGHRQSPWAPPSPSSRRSSTRRRSAFDDLAVILEGAMFKRRAQGRDYGVAVLAEGVVTRLRPQELEQHFGDSVSYDPHGHLQLEEVAFGTVLRRHLQSRAQARGARVKITDVTLGYTLRCAPPIPFDIDYTRTLGYGAVRFLLSPPQPGLEAGGLISQVESRVQVLPFQDIIDPATGRLRVRRVNIDSEHYQVARHYMIRLEASDLADATRLDSLAKTAGMSPDAFRTEYSAAVG